MVEKALLHSVGPIIDEYRQTLEIFPIFHIQRMNIITSKFCCDVCNLTQTFLKIARNMNVN